MSDQFSSILGADEPRGDVNDAPVDAPTDTTTDAVTDAPTGAPASWVNVVVLGGDTQRLDFTPGMTVGQAMRNSGLTRRHGQVIQVNGAPADEGTVLTPNCVVQLTSRVFNG